MEVASCCTGCSLQHSCAALRAEPVNRIKRSGVIFEMKSWCLFSRCTGTCTHGAFWLQNALRSWLAPSLCSHPCPEVSLAMGLVLSQPWHPLGWVLLVKKLPEWYLENTALKAPWANTLFFIFLLCTVFAPPKLEALGKGWGGCR